MSLSLLSRSAHLTWLRSYAPAWLLLLTLLLSLAAPAQTVPPRPDPPRLVNDLAGLLQPQEAAALEQKLVAYNDSTSSQIAVVTVPDLGGRELADYAQQLYESWGIGRKGKNNGILVLVAKQERRARIQTGYGLEGAVPDVLARRIIDNTMGPAFKQNQYYQGLDQATDQLIALARGEYKADPGDQQGNRDHSGSGWPFWLIIGLLILFVLLRQRGGGRGGRGGGFVPPIIFGDFSGGRGVFGGGGGWGGGGGGGGGGFGGFGGGSSGGGGASGSW